MMLFGIEHSERLCKSCKESEVFLRREMCLPVAKGARAPLSVVKRFGAICFDCAAAENLRKFTRALTWPMARIAVGNDRMEMLRLPGVPIGSGFAKAALGGDLERLHEWQDAYLPKEDWS